MNISARLRSLMQQRGMNLTKLAKRSGLAGSSISRYLSGRQVPGADALGKLAEALEVSSAEIIGPFAAPALSTKEQFLLQLEQIKELLLREDMGGFRDSVAGASVPLFFRAPGLKESPETKRFLAPADAAGADAIAVRIADDLNSPRLQPGDVAVFSAAEPWKNGDICALVFASGGGSVGRVSRKGKQLILSGIKPGSPSRTMPVDEVKAIRKLVWIKSS